MKQTAKQTLQQTVEQAVASVVKQTVKQVDEGEHLPDHDAAVSGASCHQLAAVM